MGHLERCIPSQADILNKVYVYFGRKRRSVEDETPRWDMGRARSDDLPAGSRLICEGSEEAGNDEMMNADDLRKAKDCSADRRRRFKCEKTAIGKVNMWSGGPTLPRLPCCVF